MKLYNDQRNAQVFNLFFYLYISYMFRAFLLAHIEKQVYNFHSGSSLLGIQRPGADTIPIDLNHCRSCKPATEDGLKESPKQVRQK
jgi:hypothetical protein